MPEPKLKKSTIEVSVGGEDISNRIERVQFHDRLHGSSSDLAVDIFDPNFEWLLAGKPNKGDLVTVVFSYEFTDTILPVNRFEVDEIEVSEDATVIKVNCQQTPLREKLREKRDETYEDTSLKEIAKTIAARNGLSIKGTIDNVTFDEVAQNNQTDLAFIKKLAEDWGQIVKVDRQQEALIFESWERLEADSSKFSLDRRHLNGRVRLKDSMAKTYDKAKVQYRDADKKETIEKTVKAEELPGQGTTNENKPDILKINTKVENEAQAQIKAKEALRRKNKEAVTGSIETEGNWVFQAGFNFELSNFGPRFDGTWQLDEPRHSYTKSSGWRVQSKIRKLR